ncbi:MAG TPA: hypothetical protein DCQ14_03855 [Firmicutes bacterium]|nr:hypothetical protein [Bacillota bacterium]
MGLEIIREIYKKKADAREKTRINTIGQLCAALEKLAQEVSFAEAYIFGSVIKPYRFGDASDLDIAFKELERDRLYTVISFLSDYLQREVNAVHMEDVHFQEKIVREGMRWKRE